ncbi:hypothetical protein ACD661_15225 [Legionella lytica]|uniref:Uncharacterized protein n=1 Tax=Legionella lytica TaxID=96232 RepID=A0ABW8DD57_9GAMM
MRQIIEATIDRIEKIYANLPDKEGKVHLMVIKSLCKQSIAQEDKISVVKVLEALCYIESIKVQNTFNFFASSRSLRANLVSQHRTVLPQRETAQTPFLLATSKAATAIKEKSIKVFTDIHEDLANEIVSNHNARIVQNIQTSPEVWHYNYSTDNDGFIMNQVIGDWQNMMIEHATETKKSYQDFMRDFSIHGLCGQNHDQVDELLNHLVTNSDYPEEKKNELFVWLQQNGGQNNNRFVDFLFINGAFTPQPASLTRTVAKENSWSLEKGKIILNFELAIFALCAEGDVLIANTNKRLRREPNPEKIDIKTTLPLANVSAKLQLTINNEGKVVPHVSRLNVTSYNEELINPALNASIKNRI